MAPNILVMGASGHVGKELVNRLAHTGNHVRAAVHDPLKLNTLLTTQESKLSLLISMIKNPFNLLCRESPVSFSFFLLCSTFHLS